MTTKIRIRWVWKAAHLVTLTTLLGLGGCRDQNADISDSTFLVVTDFAKGADNWKADYSDYQLNEADSLHFVSGIRSLPMPLDTTRKAFLVGSTNASDDLFMFLKRKLSGLRPTTNYQIAYELELASKYPAQSVGIGGSPGLALHLKVGASAVEPVKVAKNQGYYLNLDKGDQATGGKDVILIGDASNDSADDRYRLVRRFSQGKNLMAQTDKNGALWLVVGTDSGYEGRTDIYYSRILVSLRPLISQ
ncbi:hypothetical protein [Spirosoma endbachense]|uniref:Uncharacterized protein n=1 Tax=Spirosoma endbachense TaxID=2666025 RepID=A0A6P1W8Z3_9BACT|nr:hypothetical protein [Spirosoma endbachense]QHW00167.1 hypothetical protein GJR95_36395 [Spirosoma endbachense]